ncbi:FimB/Mfa2 family fimbrial subunit [Parabacteroides sp. PF5-6]|uniref:FimB/Mfa2 family fimbrial subunit n=1 Tax=Parabacteroides sp. PF5-6 TaxID=1742403 RepID=UPI0024049D0D|nr:FimB/Mfa2 family fimbrial subunit [Parabacteroides sp. PF5-6]MDF9831246.1 hypothetical protein [Parabacteroides sp. PF5-6]
MKRIRYIASLWIGVVGMILTLPTSCAVDTEVLTCSYNVELEYWYTREWTKEENMVANYIYRINEYVFDQSGLLYQINELPVGSGKRAFVSTLTLPDGEYTAVAWGNLSRLEQGWEPEIGTTTLEEARIRLSAPYATEQAAWGDTEEHGNIDPLYYGYTTFSVRGDKPQRLRVGMTHAHLLLEVVVKWARNAPANTRDFSLELRDVPAVYGFFPEYTESKSAASTNPITHRIPEVMEKGTGHTRDYRLKATMDIARALKAEFVTNRLTDQSHPLFTVYAGEQQLIKDLDLEKYFRTMQLGLSRNLRQEFRIQVMIYDDRVEVSPMVFSDWENGGTIGGNV